MEDHVELWTRLRSTAYLVGSRGSCPSQSGWIHHDFNARQKTPRSHGLSCTRCWKPCWGSVSELKFYRKSVGFPDLIC